MYGKRISAVPDKKPADPRFSCGPSRKPPGWSPMWLAEALLGRSHRSDACRQRIQKALHATAKLLDLPDSYRVIFTPGSDTGAVNAAMWNWLGRRKAQILAFDVFGRDWAHDVLTEMAVKGEVLRAAPFCLPDLSRLDPACDQLFTWNGTTTGVCLRGIPKPGATDGLRICDATSALFALPVELAALDIVTYSWQKSLGGEAGFGVMILSPKAVCCLEEAPALYPVGKSWRLRGTDGLFRYDLCQGSTINSISMLLVEDYLAALRWVESQGGLQGLVRRCAANFAQLEAWIENSQYRFACADARLRSKSSVTLLPRSKRFAKADIEEKWRYLRAIGALLAKHNAAFDIVGHRREAPCLRLWCGPTVETVDVGALLPWLDWAFETVEYA